MEFTWIFLTLSILSLVSNGLTLFYILKTFDTSVHVFALLFTDATLSTFFSGLSVIADSLVEAAILQSGTGGYCLTSFISTYLPSHSGITYGF
jgi:hypothetical protein